MERTKEEKITKLLNAYRSLPIEKQIDNRYEILVEIISNMKYIYEDEGIARNLSNYLLDHPNSNLQDFFDIKYCKVFMVPNCFIKEIVQPVWRDSIIFTLKNGRKELVNPDPNLKGFMLSTIPADNIIENTFFTFYKHTIFYTTSVSMWPRDIFIMYYKYLNNLTQSSEQYQKYCIDMDITHEEFQNYFEFLDKEFAITTRLSLGISNDMISEFVKLRDDVIEDINWGNQEVMETIYNAAFNTLYPNLISEPIIASIISNEYASYPYFDIEQFIDISACYNYVLRFDSIKNCKLDFNPFKSYSILSSTMHSCMRFTMFYNGYETFVLHDLMRNNLPSICNDCLIFSSFTELSENELRNLFYAGLNNLLNEVQTPFGFHQKIIYRGGPITRKELTKFMKMLKMI